MIFTDPTYLRTIYDGLLSGTLHKDNASSLPLGLVGIYEEALPPANHIKERQRFIDFFSAWALLKKDVSIDFVASLLGWPEEQVLDYIARYSKWFNAPTSGKYVLYHERLRSFMLQKISYSHFKACNETIISQCQLALQTKDGGEREQYALEHLSSHLLVDGMMTGDGSNLKKFCRSREVWNRQIALSSGLNWTILSIKNLIEFNSKYDPLDCQEDYHNLLLLNQQATEFIKHFNSLAVHNINDADVDRLYSVNIDNEYDAQYLYVTVIVKMHRIISSDLEDVKCKRLIVKLDEVLGKLQSIDHGKLNFHDILPLHYFQDLMLFYNNIDLSYINILSGSYRLVEFLQNVYLPYTSYDEFIESYFSFDLFPNNISSEILDIFYTIQQNLQSLNLLEVQSLDQLYNFIAEQKIDRLELPAAILIIPVLFNKNFQMNKRCDIIHLEWKLDICECYVSNITSFAFTLCRAKTNDNVDSDTIQKQIDWFAMNWLSSHKYDVDLYLSFVSEHIYWREGVTEFENWIIEMLSNRSISDTMSLIDDQKYQVLVDFYWGDDKLLNEKLTEAISPFQVRYYIEEAEASKLIVFEDDVITVQETYELDAKDFLQSDFGTGPYIRSLGSVNSPVSVKNINWVQILPKLKNADKTTLYATMHKVFLNALCYSNKKWADIPTNVKQFYNLDWVEFLVKNE